VRVESAFALEMQQLGPLLVERVNTHLGWRAVGKLVLKQGPVAPLVTQKPLPKLDGETVARVEAQVAGVADEGLREALAKLGRAVALRAKTQGDDTAS
jgi:hypothetical protein